MWKQRARSDWIREGDNNTIFLHRRASTRKNKNAIKALEDKEGILCHDERTKVSIVIDYFSTLFKSEVGLDRDIWSTKTDFIPPKVPRMFLEGLGANYFEEEVKIAVFQLYPSKAPGIDGFSALFLQKFWDFVNITLIILISKVPNPVKIT